jgi:hypothetical protein
MLRADRIRLLEASVLLDKDDLAVYIIGVVLFEEFFFDFVVVLALSLLLPLALFL